jgi:hypothetical protein
MTFRDETDARRDRRAALERERAALIEDRDRLVREARERRRWYIWNTPTLAGKPGWYVAATLMLLAVVMSAFGFLLGLGTLPVRHCRDRYASCARR